jgi:RNA polymerase-binding transcription factor DksA
MSEESLADVASDITFADVRRDVMELRDVETALRKLDLGTYGVCSSCKAAIAAARLEAYPTAKRCLKCEAAHESATELQAAHSI